MNLGKKIRECRKSKGLTQAQLGKHIGVAESTISLYESNKRAPDNEIINRIASFFNVSLDYLIGNKNNEEDNLPPLTPKDEREIARDLANMINTLDGAAAMGNVEDEEDREMLKASLETAMRLSKRIAKKKFTPKKYRHNYNNEDNKKD